MIKFETRKCAEVKDFCRGICENVFHFFTLTCRKPPNSFGILQSLSNKTNRNTTTVPAEGNSSKRPIWYLTTTKLQTIKKRIFLKTTNKRYYLLIKQIYHAWEGYLRKIPVLRLNFPRLSAREIFRLSTDIFRIYPSQTWYICSVSNTYSMNDQDRFPFCYQCITIFLYLR